MTRMDNIEKPYGGGKPGNGCLMEIAKFAGIIIGFAAAWRGVRHGMATLPGAEGSTAKNRSCMTALPMIGALIVTHAIKALGRRLRPGVAR